MITRAEHLAWCKERALKYLDAGEISDAFASMGSDMRKHPETAILNDHLLRLGLMYCWTKDAQGMRRWIEGFN